MPTEGASITGRGPSVVLRSGSTLEVGPDQLEGRSSASAVPQRSGLRPKSENEIGGDACHELTVMVSAYGPNLSVEVPVELPVCDAVSVLGVELDAFGAIVTLPLF